jgi:hypothetical protein
VANLPDNPNASGESFDQNRTPNVPLMSSEATGQENPGPEADPVQTQALEQDTAPGSPSNLPRASSWSTVPRTDQSGAATTSSPAAGARQGEITPRASEPADATSPLSDATRETGADTASGLVPETQDLPPGSSVAGGTGGAAASSVDQ